MAKEYIEVGTIRKGDYGLYIKLHKCRNKTSDGTFKEDNTGLKKLIKVLEGSDDLNLSIEKPEKEINRFLDLGFIDEAEAEKRLANVPAWKKYIIKLVQEK